MLSPTSKTQALRIGALLLLNCASGIIAWRMGSAQPFPDAKGYVLMSEGLRHGQFSSWYFLEGGPPETLRMPGYPLFLAAVRSLSQAPAFLTLVQLSLHFAALATCAWMVLRTTRSFRSLEFFLLFSALNIQIPFLTGFTGSDSLTATVTTVYASVFVTQREFRWGIVLGLLGGIGFQLRPALLLLPFVLTGAILLWDRKRLTQAVVHLAVFGVTLLPFGVWNLRSHGVFRVTPIEGGAGAAHLGYWNFRVPGGYADRFYWGNAFIEDLLNPFAPSPEAGAAAITEYEAEWSEINATIEGLETPDDRALQARMRGELNPGIIATRNSRYTLARERALWARVLARGTEDPIFYLKTRAYTVLRSYFTGINAVAWRDAKTNPEYAKLLAPTLLQLVFILGGLALSLATAMYRGRRFPIEARYLLTLVLYFGFVHAPFVIGSRYTMPAHLSLLAVVAMIAGGVRATDRDDDPRLNSITLSDHQA